MKRVRLIVSNVKIGGHGPFDLYELNNFDFSENLDFGERMGIYVFSERQVLKNSINHEIYYVGKTTQFSDRFYQHHKTKQLKKVNPNCLAIMDCDKDAMDNRERELIEAWSPIYNTQLKDNNK